MKSIIKTFAFEESNVLTLVDNDHNVWFKGFDVASILGYVNTSKAIQKHIDTEDKQTRGQIFEGIKMGGSKKGTGKSQPEAKFTRNEKNTIFINKKGLTSLLVKSRMSKSVDFAKAFGIDVTNHKYECKESETLGAIMKAFTGEKMNTQHSVLDYRIDLYFPDYNLAVECDENGHEDRNPAAERRRHRRITKKINCQWLRFNPDGDDFNIFQVINQIFMIIKTHL